MYRQNKLNFSDNAKNIYRFIKYKCADRCTIQIRNVKDESTKEEVSYWTWYISRENSSNRVTKLEYFEMKLAIVCESDRKVIMRWRKPIIYTTFQEPFRLMRIFHSDLQLFAINTIIISSAVYIIPFCEINRDVLRNMVKFKQKRYSFLSLHDLFMLL